MSSSIGQNPTFSFRQLVMKYFHGWLKFGWKITRQVTIIATLLLYDPPQKTNNVGLAFSVGDTTQQFTISVEQDNWNS